MYLFLTSSPCNDNVPAGVNLPCIFFERNRFVENMRRCVKPNARFVVIAADPDNYPLNDEMTETFATCFEYHGMHLASVHLCDRRTEKQAAEMVLESDLILVGGGHVPTQNAFLDRIGLHRLLKGYSGVIVGVSAGSMNCASTVYAQPEMPGESLNPDYRRFISGLGLTNINILPHYQQTRNFLLDEQRLFEDITYTDSWGRKFYAIPDGSYILQYENTAILYGDGYCISDGQIQKICSEDEFVRIGV